MRDVRTGFNTAEEYQASYRISGGRPGAVGEPHLAAEQFRGQLSVTGCVTAGMGAFGLAVTAWR